MIKTRHPRFYMILFLSLVMAFIYSACAPAATPERQPGEEEPAATELPVDTQVVETEEYKESEEPAATDETEPCMGEDNSPLVCDFTQEDGSSIVTVELPWQGRRLNIVREVLGTQLPIRDGFSLLRPIINLQVIDPVQESVVNDFNPPLVITAEFTQEELDAVGDDRSQLSIAVSDDEKGIFIPYYAYLDPNSSTGTISVFHWTSQVYWSTPSPPPPLVKSFNQVDGSSRVTIELPYQGRKLDIIERIFRDDLDESFPPDDYIREIAYLQVVDPNDNSVVHDFSPPLIMTAQYNTEDQIIADNDPYNLVINIYDHEEKSFQPYNTFIDPSSSTGRIAVNFWTSHACWRK